MKRRLDLALALVHRPRILFLDEPTTGLDIQSRTALWEEVQRLSKDDGMTVFLTTQYLEEADVLADRVGIIDHGKIVAEGTPGELKAEIGRPSVEVVPSDASDAESLRSTLARFGAPRADGDERVDRPAPAVARRSSPTWCGRSTRRGSDSPRCTCTRRRSTTSSSPRPATSWRARRTVEVAVGTPIGS